MKSYKIVIFLFAVSSLAIFKTPEAYAKDEKHPGAGLLGETLHVRANRYSL